MSHIVLERDGEIEACALQYKNMTPRLQGKFYRLDVRTTSCMRQSISQSRIHVQKINVAETRMLQYNVWIHQD